MGGIKENGNINPDAKKGSEKRGMKIAGVVTKDATYSLSPDIHTAGYGAAEILGIQYERFSVSSEDLSSFIAKMRDPKNHFAGVSIGTPHKETVISLIDTYDPAVKAMGACNTIVVKQNVDGNIKLHGKNTDYEGFKGALDEKSVDIKDKVITIWGASGAARSSLYAAGEQGAKRVYIVNRTREHAQQMKDKLAEAFKDLKIVIVNAEDEEAQKQAVKESAILVHATKVGMKEEDSPILPVEEINPSHTVVEWVYHKDITETKLEKIAREKGATVIPGRRILLNQAITQWEEFTGYKPAPKEAMDMAIPRGKAS